MKYISIRVRGFINLYGPNISVLWVEKKKYGRVNSEDLHLYKTQEKKIGKRRERERWREGGREKAREIYRETDRRREKEKVTEKTSISCRYWSHFLSIFYPCYHFESFDYSCGTFLCQHLIKSFIIRQRSQYLINASSSHPIQTTNLHSGGKCATHICILSISEHTG